MDSRLTVPPQSPCSAWPPDSHWPCRPLFHCPLHSHVPPLASFLPGLIPLPPPAFQADPIRTPLPPPSGPSPGRLHSAKIKILIPQVPLLGCIFCTATTRFHFRGDLGYRIFDLFVDGVATPGTGRGPGWVTHMGSGRGPGAARGQAGKIQGRR